MKDKLLLEAYNKAIKMKLDNDFIDYLENQMKKRGLTLLDTLSETKKGGE